MADEKKGAKGAKGARPLRSGTQLGASTGAGEQLAAAEEPNTLSDNAGIGEGQAAAAAGRGDATNYEGAEHFDMFARFARQNAHSQVVAAHKQLTFKKLSSANVARFAEHKLSTDELENSVIDSDILSAVNELGEVTLETLHDYLETLQELYSEFQMHAAEKAKDAATFEAAEEEALITGVQIGAPKDLSKMNKDTATRLARASTASKIASPRMVVIAVQLTAAIAAGDKNEEKRTMKELYDAASDGLKIGADESGLKPLAKAFCPGAHATGAYTGAIFSPAQDAADAEAESDDEAPSRGSVSGRSTVRSDSTSRLGRSSFLEKSKIDSYERQTLELLTVSGFAKANLHDALFSYNIGFDGVLRVEPRLEVFASLSERGIAQQRVEDALLKGARTALREKKVLLQGSREKLNDALTSHETMTANLDERQSYEHLVATDERLSLAGTAFASMVQGLNCGSNLLNKVITSLEDIESVQGMTLVLNFVQQNLKLLEVKGKMESPQAAWSRIQKQASAIEGARPPFNMFWDDFGILGSPDGGAKLLEVDMLAKHFFVYCVLVLSRVPGFQRIQELCTPQQLPGKMKKLGKGHVDNMLSFIHKEKLQAVEDQPKANTGGNKKSGHPKAGAKAADDSFRDTQAFAAISGDEGAYGEAYIYMAALMVKAEAIYGAEGAILHGAKTLNALAKKDVFADATKTFDLNSGFGWVSNSLLEGAKQHGTMRAIRDALSMFNNDGSNAYHLFGSIPSFATLAKKLLKSSKRKAAIYKLAHGASTSFKGGGKGGRKGGGKGGGKGKGQHAVVAAAMTTTASAEELDADTASFVAN